MNDFITSASPCSPRMPWNKGKLIAQSRHCGSSISGLSAARCICRAESGISPSSISALTASCGVAIWSASAWPTSRLAAIRSIVRRCGRGRPAGR